MPSELRVLWVGTATAGPLSVPFFEQLGERCQQIGRAVAMDMNTALTLEVKQHRPQAEGGLTTCSTWWLKAAERRRDRVRVEQANAPEATNRREKRVKRALVAAT